MTTAKDAEAWAVAQQQATAGLAITYRRDSDSVEIANAIPGQTTFRGQTNEGFTEYTQARDYLIEPSAIDFGAGAIEPQPGDLIDETDATTGTVYRYEVTAINGEPCQRWNGRHRLLRRIHTLHTATDP